MSEHPRSGAGFPGLHRAELALARAFGTNGSAATTSGSALVARSADARLMTAAFVDGRRLADHGVHYCEVRRQNGPRGFQCAVGTVCGRIPLLHGTEETKFAATFASVVVKGHGRTMLISRWPDRYQMAP